MNDPSDLLARHLQHLHLSEEDLEEFLVQPVPRNLPAALKHHDAHLAGNVLGIFAAVGGPACLALVILPLVYRNRIGDWANLLTGVGLAVSLGAVVAMLVWARSRSSLLRDGKLTRGKFSFIEAPDRQLLRSAASRAQVDDLHKSGLVKLEFSVDGQTVRAEQQLPFQYLQLAASYDESNADVLVLYEEQTPANARWVGGFLFPCPEHSSPDISLGVDD